MMGIVEIQSINAQRAERWHANSPGWSGLEWAGAMCGEAGEAANVAKKLRRWEQGLPGNRDVTPEVLRRELGEECADVFLYLCLLASHYGLNLEQEIVRKFNQKSLEQGFPERIGEW